MPSIARLSIPLAADKPKAVAPENPSTGVHIASPDIFAGYAKYRKALPVRAGFRKFFPVPPKTSFPITTPNAIPNATCHSGAEAGIVRAKSIELTKNPSLTS